MPVPTECLVPLLRGKTAGRSKLRKGSGAVLAARAAADELGQAQDCVARAHHLLWCRAGYVRAAHGIQQASLRLESWEGKVRAEIISRQEEIA